MEADLILLDLFGLDVILGMDWLGESHAVVDCYNKEITFRRQCFPEVVFYEKYRRSLLCLISAFTVRLLLKKGCKVYLTHMIDT